VDAGGTIYVVTSGFVDAPGALINHYRELLRISPDGMTRTVVAGGNEIRNVDGPISSSRFTDPTSVAVGPAGRVVVGETGASAIRLVDTQIGVVTTLGGGTGAGDVDGPALTQARFHMPQDITGTSDGTLYVADTGNHSVRRISGGVVSTLSRGFHFPQGVATPPSGGRVYVAGPTSSVGWPLSVVGADGSAAVLGHIAPSTFRAALAVDAAGNVFVTEFGNVVVIPPSGDSRRVLASGIRATELALDSAGNVYFVSTFGTVGVIDPAGNAVIRAGQPNESGSVDGVGQEARFNHPNALAVDTAGNMYVAEGTKVRKVTPQGVVSTILDITRDEIQGAPSGFSTSSFTATGSLQPITGLAWTGGALYLTVLNAVLRIAQ
jgi:sugar lactone lactonase YvrE